MYLVIPPSIQEDSTVLLHINSQHKWLVSIKEQPVFHTHKGSFDMLSLVGRPYGCIIVSSHNLQATAHFPTWKDRLYKMKHVTQVIYPKDAGVIAIQLNVLPGSRVFEAGCGSGGLTSLLSHLVTDSGHVYAFDEREASLETSQANVEILGNSSTVSFHLEDVTQNIALDDESVDCAILDLPTPWLVLPHIYRILAGSGIVCAFVPTISQISQTVNALEEWPFDDIRVQEYLKRDYQVKSDAIRPTTRMIGHTGYLIFARKFNKPE